MSPNASKSLPFSTDSGAGSPADAAAQLAAASKSWNKASAANKEAASAQLNGVNKKKRPIVILKNDEGEGSDDGYDENSGREGGSPSKKDVGSFAEWKDRKKHKSLPKKGLAIQNE